MFGMGMQELIIVGIIAVLLFGKRLPEVARSLGSSYREFRKGLNDLQSEVNVNDSYRSNSSSNYASDDASTYGELDDQEEATAPKFQLPPDSAESSTKSGADTDESTPSDEISRPIGER